MVFFMVVLEAPKSYNADNRKKVRYTERLQEQARQIIQRYPEISLFQDALYIYIYYFHRVKSEVDVDNMSKPILDGLRRIVYTDDSQVIKRTAMKIDLSASYTLSNENIPDYIYEELLASINNDEKKHILFIEVGKMLDTEIRIGGKEV